MKSRLLTREQGDTARSESGYSAADELDANKAQQIKEDLGVENLDRIGASAAAKKQQDKQI